MKRLLFQGVATALATPFTNNTVNITELKKFINFQIDSGVDALLVCGTTGESSTMSVKEKILSIDCVIKAVNKKSLLLLVLPIILYNVPSRTGINILPQTCFELSKTDNIVGIKEASGNISQIAEIASICGDNLHIYSGNDDQIVPTLSLGAKGVISVLSNIIPELACKITNSFFNNDIKTSRFYQLKALPLIKTLFSETNPIPVKEALNLLGFNFGKPRLPLISASDYLSQQLIDNLKDLNLL